MRSSFRKVHIDERETWFGKSDKSCQPMKPDWNVIWFLTASNWPYQIVSFFWDTFQSILAQHNCLLKSFALRTMFLCVCVFCVVNLDCAYRFGFVVHLVFHRDTHSTSTKVLESWALLVEFYRWSFLMPLLRENANLHIALLLFDRGSKYKVLIKNRFETKLQIWFVLQWLWLIRIISFSCDFVQILVVGT